MNILKYLKPNVLVPDKCVF